MCARACNGTTADAANREESGGKALTAVRQRAISSAFVVLCPHPGHARWPNSWTMLGELRQHRLVVSKSSGRVLTRFATRAHRSTMSDVEADGAGRGPERASR